MVRMEQEASARDNQPVDSGSDRSAAARRAAATRRENKILSASAYGRLLLALRRCQVASDQAKSRAANNTRYSEYGDRSTYRWVNYRASRNARQRDYEAKRKAIDEACQAAAENGVVFGWAPSGSLHVPWIVYFELPSGQVSFHSDTRGEGPDYGGSWDGVKDVGAARIQEAINGLLPGSMPPPAPCQEHEE